MSHVTSCPKCGHETLITDFRIGRTNHEVCVGCGWCVSHQNYFASVRRSRAEQAAPRAA